MKVSAYAPVSVGNFIVGFDLLGAALRDVSGALFGDVVRIEPAERLGVRIEGEFAKYLPDDPKANIVSDCIEAYHQVLQGRGLALRSGFTLVLDKRLPVGSGLGSSAASIVAALVALNAWYGEALTKDELLRLAGELEGKISGGVHYDNVAPSLLGGLQLMLPGEACCELVPLPETWRFVVHYPGIEVSTRSARAILPKSFLLKDMVTFGRHLAGFVSAAHRGDEAAMLTSLQDELIAPHRASLVPGFKLAEDAARKAGALAFGLSGSGPTVIAVVREADALPVARAIEQAFPASSRSFTRLCALDTLGARCL